MYTTHPLVPVYLSFYGAKNKGTTHQYHDTYRVVRTFKKKFPGVFQVMFFIPGVFQVFQSPDNPGSILAIFEQKSDFDPSEIAEKLNFQNPRI